MAAEPLSEQQIHDLIDQTHTKTGVRYPARGLQPYYTWLMRTLHTLLETAAADLHVWPSDEAPTAIWIAPGSASIDGHAIDWPGQNLDLAEHNNSTIHCWMRLDGSDEPIVEVDDENNDWPATKHLKLATITLDAGRITSIQDRRFQTIFAV